MHVILGSVLGLFLLAASGVVPLLAGAAEVNSCPVCHTNGAIMKSLYRPPALQPAEGEG